MVLARLNRPPTNHGRGAARRPKKVLHRISGPSDGAHNRIRRRGYETRRAECASLTSCIRTLGARHFRRPRQERKVNAILFDQPYPASGRGQASTQPGHQSVQPRSRADTIAEITACCATESWKWICACIPDRWAAVQCSVLARSIDARNRICP